MAQEVNVNTDSYVLAELAFGYPFRKAGEEQETVSLGAVRLFAYTSVLRYLARRRATSRAEAGEHFNSAEWMPSEEEVVALQETTRPMKRRLQILDGIDSGISASPNTELRDDQLVVKTSIKSLLENSKEPDLSAHGYIKLPTGVGKTAIYSSVVEDMKREEGPDDPIRALVLVPSLITLHQTVGEDGERGFSRFGGTLGVGKYYGDEKRLGDDVVVMTYQSMLRVAEDPARAGELEKFDVIIADEAHRALGKKTRETVERLQKGKIALGFTATPDYSPKKGVKLLMPESAYKQSLREAIENGTLSPLQYWVCKTRLSVSHDPRRKEFTEKELANLAGLEPRQRMAMDLAQTFVSRGRRGVITCNTIDEADYIAGLLNDSGETLADRPFNAQPAHGGTDDIENVFQQLNKGTVDVITIVDIETGWDVPAASFLVNLRPTASEVKALQRLGRIMRPHRNSDGLLVPAQVVDLVDSTQKQCLTVPALLGDRVCKTGKIIASSERSDAPSEYFTLADFPDHLRWQLQMVDGVEVGRSSLLGVRSYMRLATSLRLLKRRRDLLYLQHG